MSGRRQKTRDLKPGIYIVGEGITEQYYFSHIKKILDLNCRVKPRFFGNTSIKELDKKIERLLLDDVIIICVFDADVSQYNSAEKKRLKALYKKYGNNENVLLCDSLPSIEFWFLIHYLDTNRIFKNSNEVEELLKTYISNYKKTEVFLEKEKWVKDLCSENQLAEAIKRASQYQYESGSYSNVYKAFEILFKNKI
jgi:hypothetical protein